MQRHIKSQHITKVRFDTLSFIQYVIVVQSHISRRHQAGGRQLWSHSKAHLIYTSRQSQLTWVWQVRRHSQALGKKKKKHCCEIHTHTRTGRGKTISLSGWYPQGPQNVLAERAAPKGRRNLSTSGSRSVSSLPKNVKNCQQTNQEGPQQPKRSAVSRCPIQ